MGGRDQSQVKIKFKKFQKVKSIPKDVPKSHNCHRYDFLVRLYWNGLNFFELFKLFIFLGLITTPHVLYDHMTYV